MVKLGDLVIDEVSGFKGVAVARHSYLQGCDRISVQPEVDKDGKLPATETFDEGQLTTVEASKATRRTEPDHPGGPEKYADRGR